MKLLLAAVGSRFAKKSLAFLVVQKTDYKSGEALT